MSTARRHRDGDGDVDVDDASYVRSVVLEFFLAEEWEVQQNLLPTVVALCGGTSADVKKILEIRSQFEPTFVHSTEVAINKSLEHGATSVVADEKSPETIRPEESSAVVLGAAESKAREYVLANARMVNESAPRPVMDKKLSRSTSIRAASRGSDQGFKRALPMALGSLIYDAQVVVNAIQKRILG